MKKEGKVLEDKSKQEYCILLIFISIFVIRCFWGFDWSDETYYIALPHRFLTGDNLFVNSWDIHQIGAILLTPFVYLYKILIGSTDGIILFFRILYIIFNFGVIVISYEILKKVYNKKIALYVNIIFMSFVPGAISNLSYNTMGLGFIYLALVILIWIYREGRDNLKYTIILGIFYALAIQSYPTLIITFPAILFFVYKYLNKKSIIAFLGGIVSVVILFLFNLIGKVKLNEFFQNIKYLFNDPEHISKNIFVTLQEYISWILNENIILIIILLLIFIWFRKSNKFNNIIFIITVIEISIKCLKIIIYNEKNYSNINSIFISLTIIGILLFSVGKIEGKEIKFMFVIGIGVSLGIQYGTNNGPAFSTYGLIFSAIAILIILERQNKKIGFIIIPIVIVLIFMRFNYVYRDFPIYKCDTKITSGPAKGIYTNSQKAKEYEKIVETIKENEVNGPIFYSKLLPFGYLLSNNRAASPSLWRTELKSERVKIYNSINPELIPKGIYIIKEPYGISNGKNELGEELKKYLENKKYDVFENEYMKIYKIE